MNDSDWVCPICKQKRREDGCDPCIPNLPGIRFACCGHDGRGGYLWFKNDVIVRFVVMAIEYKDGRDTIFFIEGLTK